MNRNRIQWAFHEAITLYMGGAPKISRMNRLYLRVKWFVQFGRSRHRVHRKFRGIRYALAEAEFLRRVNRELEKTVSFLAGLPKCEPWSGATIEVPFKNVKGENDVFDT